MKSNLKLLGARALGAVGVVGTSLFGLAASAQVAYESQYATTTALGGQIAADVMKTNVYAIGVVISIAVFSAGVYFIWRMIKRRTGFGKQM